MVRVDTDGMGLEITEIVGVEGFKYLRNLMRYNSPDSERIERARRDHIGSKRCA